MIDRFICSLYVSNDHAQPLYLMGRLHNHFAAACPDSDVFVSWVPAKDITETRYRVVIERYYRGYESILSLFNAVIHNLDYRFALLCHQTDKGWEALYKDEKQEEHPME